MSFVILRPARLDERDAAIVRAVVKAWGEGHGAATQEMLQASGLSSKCTLYERIRGSHRWHRVSLVERNWLCMDAGMRTLRPGPRFGGLGGKGTVYELIEVLA